jgi:WD40 repeat protein
MVRGHGSAVYCANWDKTGSKIITGSDDYLVKVWSARSGYLLRTLRGHEKEITDLAVDYSAKYLATSSNDCTVRVWSLVNGAHMAVLRGHEKTVATVSWCPSVKHPCILSTSLDGTIRLWTEDPAGADFPDTLKFIPVRLDNNVKVTAFSWSPGGTRFVTGGQDGRVRVFSVRPPGMVAELQQTHNREVMSAAWSHRGPRFATAGSQDGTIRVWDVNARARRYECVKTLQVPQHHVQQEGQSRHHPRLTNIAWSMHDDFIVAALCIQKQPSKLLVWSAKTGELVHALLGHQGDSYVLDAHPTDHRVFLTASYDRSVILWDIYRGVKLRTFHLTSMDPDNKIVDARFSPNGDGLVASDVQGNFEVYGTSRDEFWHRVPTEQFFDTDYHAFSRDDNDFLVDNATRLPPHQMPKATLCNYQGIAHDFQPPETLTLDSQPGMDPAIYETNRKQREDRELDEEKIFNALFTAPPGAAGAPAPPAAPAKQSNAARRREVATNARLNRAPGSVIIEDDDMTPGSPATPSTGPRSRGRPRLANVHTLSDMPSADAIELPVIDDDDDDAPTNTSTSGRPLRRLRRQASASIYAVLRDLSSSSDSDNDAMSVDEDANEAPAATADPTPGSAAAVLRDRQQARQRRNGRDRNRSRRDQRRAQQERERRARQEEEYALSDDDGDFGGGVSEDSEEFNPRAPAEIPSLSTDASEDSDPEVRAMRNAQRRRKQQRQEGRARGRGRPRKNRSSEEEEMSAPDTPPPRSNRKKRRAGADDDEFSGSDDDDDGAWGGSSNAQRTVRLSARELRERSSQARSLNEIEDEMDQQMAAEEKRLQELQIRRHRKEKVQFYPVWLTNRWPQLAYSPQLDDEVVFFRKGHELYLNEYQEFASEDNIPEQIPELTYCRVVDVDYIRLPFIHCYITLETLHPHPRIPRLISGADVDSAQLAGALGDESVGESPYESHDSFMQVNLSPVRFKVHYHAIAAKSPEFLSLRSRFDQAMRAAWYPGKPFAAWMYDEKRGDSGTGEWYKGVVKRITVPESTPTSSSSSSAARTPFPDAWECLSVQWEGSTDLSDVSPWEIEELDAQGTQCPVEIETLNPEECGKLATHFQSICSAKDARTIAVFEDEVDIGNYPDYPNLNPKPMDLKMITDRLGTKYYRSPRQLIADIRLIAENCIRFNGADHDFSNFALNLAEELVAAVESHSAGLDTVRVVRELEEGSVNDPIVDGGGDDDDEDDDDEVVVDDDEPADDDDLGLGDDDDARPSRSKPKKTSKSKSKSQTTRSSKGKSKPRPKPKKSSSSSKGSKKRKRDESDDMPDMDEDLDPELAAAIAASRAEAEAQGILPKKDRKRPRKSESAGSSVIEDFNDGLDDDDDDFGKRKRKRGPPKSKSKPKNSSPRSRSRRNVDSEEDMGDDFDDEEEEDEEDVLSDLESDEETSGQRAKHKKAAKPAAAPVPEPTRRSSRKAAVVIADDDDDEPPPKPRKTGSPKKSQQLTDAQRKRGRPRKIVSEDDEPIDVVGEPAFAFPPADVPSTPTSTRRLATLRVDGSAIIPSPFKLTDEPAAEEPRKSGRVRFRTDPVAGRSEAEPLSVPTPVLPPIQLVGSPSPVNFAASITQSPDGRLPRLTLKKAANSSEKPEPDASSPQGLGTPPPRKQRKLDEPVSSTSNPDVEASSADSGNKRKRGRPKGSSKGSKPSSQNADEVFDFNGDIPTYDATPAPVSAPVPTPTAPESVAEPGPKKKRLRIT